MTDEMVTNLVTTVGVNGTLLVMVLFYAGKFLEKLVSHISVLSGAIEKTNLSLATMSETIRKCEGPEKKDG